MNDSPTTITFYLARTHDGYFACGSKWVNHLDDARLYRTIGPVKSAVTKWVKNSPTMPVPEILEWKLDIATATVIDQVDRTQKAIQRAEKVRLARQTADLERRRKRLEQDIARNRDELRSLSQ